ncbi:MAG TPA: amidase [Candidatus Binataceae bacterium]|nr:amidase [Candidatus Binataceae bacterium]
MPISDDLAFAPAYRLLAMLKSREISAVELTDTFIERIESLNHGINAVVTLVEDRAAREAEDSDNRLGGKGEVRPLEGLPITIKDSIITEGIRSTWGTKKFEHHVATYDAPTVARLRAAGAIIICKTNTPELTMDYDCDNPLFGQTNNPWDHSRVPGGSSGGEAAALASGMAALGLGSDYGGSIRVPSHFCGVTGLKPSWGTIPGAGHMSPGPAAPPPVAHMATIGPMARYVDDLTLAYNIVRGAHPSSPHTVPTPEAHPEQVNIKELRCALFTAACGTPVDSDIRAAVERAGKALQKLGVPVDEVKPPIDEGPEIWWQYAMADGGKLMQALFAGHEHTFRDRLKAQMGGSSGEKSASDYFLIALRRDAWRVQLAEFMEKYPIIIGPPFCSTAFKHGALEVDIDGKNYSLYEANWPVMWGNCAGVPGVVVPAGLDRNKLPTGVQVNGRAFGEESVLAIARALEHELGGFKRPPL